MVPASIASGFASIARGRASMVPGVSLFGSRGEPPQLQGKSQQMSLIIAIIAWRLLQLSQKFNFFLNDDNRDNRIFFSRKKIIV
jgi:hypothetical protein